MSRVDSYVSQTEGVERGAKHDSGLNGNIVRQTQFTLLKQELILYFQ